MAHTVIGDLTSWPVQVVLAAIAERQPRKNSILTSSLAIQNNTWANRLLADGAVQVELPVLTPLTGTYTLQNPGTPPSIGNMGATSQRAAGFYREAAWGRDSFSVAQSGGIDTISYAADRINNVRFDNWENTLIAQAKGIFKSTAYANLKVTTPNEAPVASAGSNAYWTTDIFHDTIGLLGIREEDMAGGVIIMHPKLRTYLIKQDEIDYVKASSGDFTLSFYKGLRVVVDDRMIRAGTSDGYVYPFYMFGPQTVVFGMANQSTDGTLASSMSIDKDVPNLKAALYDRTVTMVHVNGAIWQPALADGGALTIAKGGPTDTQLGTANAWATAYTDVKVTRILWGEVNL